MPIEFVGIIALIVGAWALRRGQGFAVKSFIPSTLFGASAAVNAPGLGSIQPAQILLAVFGLVVFADRRNILRASRFLRFPSAGFWLLCTWAYGVAGAFFIPRILAARFLVNPIGSAASGSDFSPLPIGPTSGNINQSIYFTGDAVCFFAVVALASTPRGFRAVTLALLAYCVGDIVMALIDLATYYTGTVYLLDFIRNAKYIIFIDVDDSSMKRVIGSFTEASSFASATMAVLGFSTRLWVEGVRPRLSLFIALSALTLLLLSTSTTAYVGMAICLSLFYASCCWKLMTASASPRVVLAVVFIPLVVGCCVCALMLHPSTYQALHDFLDVMVFNKSSSQSGIERSRFNREALQSFFDSAGVGSGIGGVRTSSFLLAVLANLGVVGGAAYAGFFGMVLFARDPTVGCDTDRKIRAAARDACIWLVVAGSISGALIDLGLPFFAFAALACTRPEQPDDAEARWAALRPANHAAGQQA